MLEKYPPPPPPSPSDFDSKTIRCFLFLLLLLQNDETSSPKPNFGAREQTEQPSHNVGKCKKEQTKEMRIRNSLAITYPLPISNKIYGRSKFLYNLPATSSVVCVRVCVCTFVSYR